MLVPVPYRSLLARLRNIQCLIQKPGDSHSLALPLLPFRALVDLEGGRHPNRASPQLKIRSIA